jgi:branched-subunit amino acid aminotransferase/4-amino-4-deoxychorismate lyase
MKLIEKLSSELLAELSLEAKLKMLVEQPSTQSLGLKPNDPMFCYILWPTEAGYLQEAFLCTREELCLIPIIPTGFLRGIDYGENNFEGLKMVQSREGDYYPFYGKQHMIRLFEGAKNMGFVGKKGDKTLPRFDIAIDNLMEVIESLHGMSNRQNHYLRPLLQTFGNAKGVAKPLKMGLILTIEAVYLGEYHTGNDVRLCYNEAWPRRVYSDKTTLAAKTGATGTYVAGAKILGMARELGFNDALVLTKNQPDGLCVADTSSANVFFVKGRTIYVPSSKGRWLQGITGQHCMQLLKEDGYEIRFKNFPLSWLAQMDCCFLTGTAVGPKLVSEITRLSGSDNEVVESIKFTNTSVFDYLKDKFDEGILDRLEYTGLDMF